MSIDNISLNQIEGEDQYDLRNILESFSDLKEDTNYDSPFEKCAVTSDYFSALRILETFVVI